MKVLIAPDSFKETLSAGQVGETIKKGFLAAQPHWEISVCPMADGGEGTFQALIDATNGEKVECEVLDPLERCVRASYGILGDGKTAAIEMAAASGLELLKSNERDPKKTTSFGTGQLIKNALDRGITSFIIGIGGSATNDGGVGMLQALGCVFTDKKGENLLSGGENLSELETIDTSGLDQRLNQCDFQIACDVDNFLTGKNGASSIYGPQKGAASQDIALLDEALSHYASVVKKKLGNEIANVPGAGAAGGLGAAFIGFFPSELKSGGKIVADTVNLRKRISPVDLVITGEGGINHQTVNGKAPIQVADIAKEFNIPVIAICGSVMKGHENVYNRGINAVFSSILEPGPMEEIKKNAERNLLITSENVARIIEMK